MSSAQSIWAQYAYTLIDDFHTSLGIPQVPRTYPFPDDLGDGRLDILDTLPSTIWSDPQIAVAPKCPYGHLEEGTLDPGVVCPVCFPSLPFGMDDLKKAVDIIRAPRQKKITVGILGGGAAGLYAAMIINSFKDSTISWQLFEANEKRLGGRLHTHKFSDSPNDYYDAGAMRFPDIPFMDRVFDLFRRFGFDKDGTLIPYVMSTTEDVLYFNDIGVTSGDFVEKSAGVNVFGFPIPPKYFKRPPKDWVNDKLKPFRDRLRNNFREGWKYLMQYDQYSTRAYMSLVKKRYSTELVNYLETLLNATGSYNQAFSESVLSSLEFDYQKDVKWFCVRGGCVKIVDAMIAELERKAKNIHMGQRVCRMSTLRPIDSRSDTVGIEVRSTNGQTQSLQFSHCISTMPLPCLGFMQRTTVFSPRLHEAIRTLHYSGSVKVAIKFKYRWWEDEGIGQKHRGGLSTTDLPTRVVVYPSYGIGSNDATMIVSYTRLQDSDRMSTLARHEVANNNNDNDGDGRLDEIAEIILRDLAAIHELEYATLRDNFVKYHVYDWSGDRNAVGAFAPFSPGQYKTLYPEVTKPFDGIIHFAGEATSVHHGWLVGALNSAYRAVYEILVHENRSDLIEKLRKNWGQVDEIDHTKLALQVACGIAQHLADKGDA